MRAFVFRLMTGWMLLLLMASETTAQDGKSLLLQAAEACGGESAFQNVQTYVMRGTTNWYVNGQAMEMKVEQIKVLPTRYMTTVYAKALSASEVLNGEEGYLVANESAPQPLAKPDVKRLKTQNWLDLVMIFRHASALNAQLAGTSEINGQPVDVIRIQPPAETATFLLYLHHQTHFPIHLIYTQGVGAQAQNNVWVFEDYRAVKNVKLPFRITLMDGQSKIQETQIESILLNDPLAEERLNSGDE